ncbi:MAG: hypothetical protein COB41_03570 [Proteobacteria bacterium]|nr:MAG: hypothetical protein COB41_03570 [Pseudomonadota bacterium]
MKNKFVLFIFLILAASISMSCNSNTSISEDTKLKALDLPTNMWAAFFEFHKKGDYKAIAVSGRDVDEDFWVYGTAYNAKSQASADNWAIKRCEYMRNKEKLAEICRIFDRGG